MVRVLHIGSIDDVAFAFADAGVSVGRPVVVMVGGAGGMDGDWVASLEALLRQVVLPIVDELGGVVVDGGTDSGVMCATGRSRAAADFRFPLIGVAVAVTVIGGAAVVIDDAAEIEPNHGLVLLVPGSSWGDEVPWLSDVATVIAQDAPSVTILVNGGDIAYDDVAASHARGRPVLVLAGTGRTADAIAAAGGTRSADPRAAVLASSNLTLVTDFEDLDAVRAALERILRGRADIDPGAGPAAGPPYSRRT